MRLHSEMIHLPRKEKLSPRQEILNEMIEGNQPTPESFPSLTAFFAYWFSKDVTAALQYACDFPIDDQNFSRVYQRVTRLVDPCNPNETLHGRTAARLAEISSWTPEKRLELTAAPVHHR